MNFRNHQEAIIILETIYRFSLVRKVEPMMHEAIGDIIEEYHKTHDNEGRITTEAFMEPAKKLSKKILTEHFGI